MRRRSSRVLPTLEVPDRPPSLSALTGIWSMRLLLSAAKRTSSLPMLRTSAALVSHSGERAAAFISESR